MYINNANSTFTEQEYKLTDLKILTKSKKAAMNVVVTQVVFKRGGEKGGGQRAILDIF